MQRPTIFFLIVFAWLRMTSAQVGPVPDEVRKRFDLDPFYQKHCDVGGLPVVGSASVSDAAIAEAAWIVQQMLGSRPDILAAMAESKTRLAVMAHDEYTTDVPEHSDLKSRVFWDRRARGLGASPEAPAVSCAEENLLGYPGDPYHLENICIHEFAHAIHAMGMPAVDPDFEQKLRDAYRQAIDDGKWKNAYAAVDHAEYWAEAVQCWFDDNRENDALHNHVDTRDELKVYDPVVARLCHDVFGDGDWRYHKPTDRPAAQRAHLADVDFESLPTFQWREEPIPPLAKVIIQTTAGDIEVELDSEKAPKTVANFLHYVHQGLYSDGKFHRSVTLENQPDSLIKIEVIQASADESREVEFLPPIALERTSETGLTHSRGTVSMARDVAADSARDHFFICVSDQPELDFEGKRDSSGQGYAAFGRVTKGMDVVEKIHQSKTKGQTLTPAIQIQRAVRLN